MGRRFAFAAWVCVALPLTFSHCSSIPGYESAAPSEDAATAPLVDAGAEVVRDAAQTPPPDATPPGCVPPSIDATVPDETDRCRFATPLAWTTGSVRFGSLDSPSFALTPSYVFFVSAGQLMRASRGLWDTPGGNSIDTCSTVSLGPVDSVALQQLLPFDSNGVCVHSLTAATHTVQCASNDQTTLQPVPGIGATDVDGGAMVGMVRGVGSAIGFLVWARDDGPGAAFYRYAAGFAAPERLTGALVTEPADIGPFSTGADSTGAGHIRASRFCYGCLSDSVDVDVARASVSMFTMGPARPTTVLSMVRFPDESFVTLETDQRISSVRSNERTELVGGGLALAGPPTGEVSIAATRRESAEAPEDVQLITSATPTSSGASWRTAPARIGVHRLAVEGRDLFVASMALDGCGASQAWIARLPRLLP